MPVNVETPIVTSTANGVTTVFPYSFTVLQATDLVVTATAADGSVTTYALNVDYSLSGVGSSSGSVIFGVAPANGLIITRYRSSALSRSTDYQQNGDLLSATLDSDLDRVWLVLQEQGRNVGQSIRVPEIGGTTVLPAAAAQRAGLLLGFDGTGQPAVVSGPIASSPVVATAKRELQTATAGQTAFTLTTMSYASATPASVLFIVDGLVLPQSEYTQTSPTVVTLNVALIGGEQVEFVAGNFTSLSSGSFAAAHTTSGTADVGSFQFRRNVEYSGGTPGFVNSCIRADTFVDNAGATAFEWCGTFVLHNKATAGENVAIYGQGNKLSGAGPTWAAVLEVIDSSGGNPTTGAVGLEVDVRGDNGDASSNRVCIDVVATRTTGSVAANMTIGYGLRFQNGGDSTVTFSALIGVLPGTVAGIGVDLSGATTLAGALKMNQSVPIIFDNTGSPPKLTSQGLGLDHLVGAALVNRLLATGGLQVATAQVVGPRVTGWALPTGTLNRTTFDQSTVTLPLLAQRVAALITDLYGAGSGHGLIGA